jgi:hypothetical protein
MTFLLLSASFDSCELFTQREHITAQSPAHDSQVYTGWQPIIQGTTIVQSAVYFTFTWDQAYVTARVQVRADAVRARVYISPSTLHLLHFPLTQLNCE